MTAPHPAAPLRIAIAGLGTVGAGVVKLLQAHGADLARRCGRPIEIVGVSARDRKRDRGVVLAGYRWHDDPLALAGLGDADVVVELIGGSEGPARALARSGDRQGQACGHRQQGAAGPSRRGAGARGGSKGRDAGLRGGGRRRHSHHQDPARGPGRQPDRAHLRHPQRHLQLHPDHDARDRPRIRRCAGRCPAPGLCRGRSQFRCRWRRRRPQARHPRRRLPSAAR